MKTAFTRIAFYSTQDLQDKRKQVTRGVNIISSTTLKSIFSKNYDNVSKIQMK